MAQNVILTMPGNVQVETTYIKSESSLTSCLQDFWEEARFNRMVAFDTEWGCNANATERNKKRAQITLLKLCNMANSCLLIDLSALSVIPNILIKFLAVKDIRFVGVNISKDLEKLKEDYGIEIRNTVELTTIAADDWDNIIENKQPKTYETWYSYKLTVPSKKSHIPFGGFRLLSEAFLGRTLSSKVPFSLVGDDNEEKLEFKYLTIPVFIALQVGIELLV